MKTLSAAILSLCLSSSAFAASDEGKVTFEKGFESHKKNIHSKSISPEETAETWKKAVRIPESSGSGGDIERVYTLLWRSPLTQGLNFGDIQLSQSFRDFDEIVTIGGNDSGGYIQQYRFTPREYDEAFRVAGNRGKITLYERDSVSWSGQFTSNTYFKTMMENGKLYKVYGVMFN